MPSVPLPGGGNVNLTPAEIAAVTAFMESGRGQQALGAGRQAIGALGPGGPAISGTLGPAGSTGFGAGGGQAPIQGQFTGPSVSRVGNPLTSGRAAAGAGGAAAAAPTYGGGIPMTSPAASAGGAAGGAATGGRAGLMASLGGARGLATRAAAPVGAGMLTQGIARGAVGEQSGIRDDILVGAGTGAAAGATGGATLATPLAPFTGGLSIPVMAAIGGLGGGLAGGIYGAVTGGGDPEEEALAKFEEQLSTFESTLNEYDVSPQTREQLLMQFSILAGDANEDEIDTIADAFREQLPGVLIQEQAAQEQQRSQEVMHAAAQAWMAPMMERTMGRATGYADQLSQSMTNAANALDDPTARAFALEEAARVPHDTATRQAYMMQQMMAMPGLYGYETQLGQGGVPQMDFQSAVNAQPIGGGMAGMGGLPPAMMDVSGGGMGGGVQAPPGTSEQLLQQFGVQG